MKVELKHLVGYLPYGLKIMVHDDFEMEMSHKRIHDNFEDDLKYISVDGVLEDFHCKPILRPLSDLKKDEYFDLYMDFCEEMESISCEYLLESLINKTKYAFNLNQLETLENWMYKNHFDWKHNLINKGLAIDINTLNPQP